MVRYDRSDFSKGSSAVNSVTPFEKMPWGYTVRPVAQLKFQILIRRREQGIFELENGGGLLGTA
jgi:hypothetical protein